MDLDKIALMNMLQAKMKYNSARQEVIAENIAGADVPGYKRKDIQKPDFKDMVKSSMVSLETTNPKHIAGTNSVSNAVTYETESDVELDMEAIELMKNNGDFAKAATTYKKMLALMREAIDGGR